MSTVTTRLRFSKQIESTLAGHVDYGVFHSVRMADLIPVKKKSWLVRSGFFRNEFPISLMTERWCLSVCKRSKTLVKGQSIPRVNRINSTITNCTITRFYAAILESAVRQRARRALYKSFVTGRQTTHRVPGKIDTYF